MAILGTQNYTKNEWVGDPESGSWQDVQKSIDIPSFDFGALTTGWTQSPAGMNQSPEAIAYLNQTYAPGINAYLQSQIDAGNTITPYGETGGYGGNLAYGYQPGSTDRIFATPSTLQNLFQQSGVPGELGAQDYINMFNQGYITSEQLQREAESAATKGDFTKFAALAAAAFGGAALAAGAFGGAGAAAGAGGAGAGEAGLAGLSAADLSSGFAALPSGAAGTVGGGAGLSTAAGSGALVNPALWSFGGSPLTGLGGLGADASWGANQRLTNFPTSGADFTGAYDPGYGYGATGQQTGLGAVADTGTFYPIEGTIPGIDPASWGSYAAGGADLTGLQSVLSSLGIGQGNLGVNGQGLLSGLLGGGNGSSSLLNSLFGGGGSNTGGSGLGGLLGAILGGTAAGLGSKGDGTVDVTTTPWGPQQPYLTQGFGAASNQLAQSQANPSQVLQPAEQGLLSTIQGDYLNPETNPYLKQTYDLAAAQVTPGIESYYAKFGRQGSGAAGNALGNAYASLSNQIYGGNYQQERTRQNAGILAAPGFAQTGYNAQFAPVENYMQAIRGNYGGTQSTPYTSNIYGEILSGALGGSQLLGGLF